MAELIGGPCNGIPVLGAAPATITCKGVAYHKAADGNYYAPGESPEVSVKVPNAARAKQGWHDLQRAVNENTPTTLRHAHRVTRAAQTKLRKRQRMR